MPINDYTAIRITGPLPPRPAYWLIFNGKWRDSGAWIDTEIWQDE